MNTFTALIKACVGKSQKTISVEIRALTSTDAKWLLQAIYGFHSVLSTPKKIKNHESTNEASVEPLTPDQQRLNQLKATKDHANNALKIERDRQKRDKAFNTISKINRSATQM